MTKDTKEPKPTKKAKATTTKPFVVDRTARPIPVVGPVRRPSLPKVATATLDNGLDVLAVRRSGVPLVELRILLPTTRTKVTEPDKARQRLLGRTMLAGTGRRTATELQGFLQELGGGLDAGADDEDLSIAGSALADRFDDLVGLAAEVLTDAAFPAGEVATERQRAQQELVLAANQPAVVAQLALLRRYYGDHPYGDPQPDADVLGKVTPAALRAYVAGRVGPHGGTLVVVGDVAPAKAIAAVEAALGGWTNTARTTPLPTPGLPTPGPVLVVDRPGAVQTNIRLLGPGVRRSDPRSPALAIANGIFGGSFTSRLTANLREDKGYTYSPSSSVWPGRISSNLAVSADVATAVTAPALVEILHELGRMATLPVDAGEVERVARYLVGVNALSLQSERGLANNLIVLARDGLGIEHLRGLPDRIAAVEVDAVLEVSSTFLAPTSFVTVLVGDAERIVPEVSRIVPVEVVAPPV